MQERSKVVRVGYIVLLVAGCNHTEPRSPTAGSHVHSVVEPGRGAEINLAFDGPSAATAKFEANSPLDWNVHSHPDDGGVVVHQSGTAASGVVEFRAPSAGTFSFLWKNKTTSPISLDVDLATDPGVRRLDD